MCQSAIKLVVFDMAGTTVKDENHIAELSKPHPSFIIDDIADVMEITGQ